VEIMIGEEDNELRGGRSRYQTRFQQLASVTRARGQNLWVKTGDGVGVGTQLSSILVTIERMMTI